MPRFRKKPVEIEAVQWTGDNTYEIRAFAGGSVVDRETITQGRMLLILTLEGMMQANVGDWIIQGIQGEFYPCKPDIFEATYEPVTQP